MKHPSFYMYRKIALCIIVFLSMAFTSLSQDYINLRNGKRIDGKITIVNLQYYDLHQAKIECNGTAYRGGKVQSFQCDGVYYGCVLKKLFTPSIKRGKINVFNFIVVNTKGGIEYNRHPDYGIQKTEHGEIIKLTYGHLRKMVSDNEAVLKQLEALGKPRFRMTTNQEKANNALLDYGGKLLEIIDAYNKS